MELAGGISTNCKACGWHYWIQHPEVRDGGGILSRLPEIDCPPTVPGSHYKPSVPLQVVDCGEEGGVIAESRPDVIRSSSSQKIFRIVNCFDCQYEHKVSSHSTSSLCPTCGSHIDLRNVIINDRTAQKISTRGDVTVEKLGALLGTGVICGNLIVEGQVAGSINASGQVAFRSSGKVLGEVRCAQLLVEKKSSVQFLQPVYAESAEIHGMITGRFEITGRLLLTRWGQISGSIHAKSMLMEAGSRLEAILEILPQPLPPIPASLQSVAFRSSIHALAMTPAESLALWASESPPTSTC